MWVGQIITNVEEVKLSEHKNIPNRDGQVINSLASGLIVSNICAVTCMYGM